MFWPNRSSTTLSHTCQHHAEITQSHTFAALIKLSTTTHNLLTFNVSEISSNNSEKLSLLPDRHLRTFLLDSSYSSLLKFPDVKSHGRRITLALFSHQKKRMSWLGVKIHLRFCSHLIHLTPKSLFPRPKT